MHQTGRGGARSHRFDAPNRSGRCSSPGVLLMQTAGKVLVAGRSARANARGEAPPRRFHQPNRAVVDRSLRPTRFAWLRPELLCASHGSVKPLRSRPASKESRGRRKTIALRERPPRSAFAVLQPRVPLRIAPRRRNVEHCPQWSNVDRPARVLAGIRHLLRHFPHPVEPCLAGFLS